MPLKKTIAIAGATEEAGIAIARKLANAYCRILLLSSDESGLIQILADIKKEIPHADADIVGCEKEGCWEADIIILAVKDEAKKEMAEKIKEVATQKIVVNISGTTDTGGMTAKLESVLPYSKIVYAATDANTEEMHIAGEDEDANETVAALVRSAGFKTFLIQNLF